jgi:hypothetical protein
MNYGTWWMPSSTQELQLPYFEYHTFVHLSHLRMDPPRFRFGSGSRPVASTSLPIRRNGESSSSTGVNDLLGKLR